MAGAPAAIPDPKGSTVPVDSTELRSRVDAISWYHSIDLGQGITTPGTSTTPPLAGAELPDFAGRSVLDVGAWDGYYSFLAEQQGASRVVALDHYAWCLDWGAREAYWAQCRQRGTIPDLSRDTRDFWLTEAPGRAGFDLAHRARGSRVEAVIGDFMTMDLASLGGPFDIVLFLGVLYHLKEPLTALERLRSLCRQVVVVETEAVRVEGYSDASLLMLCPGDEVGRDYTDWYITTETGLHGLCRGAGYQRTVTVRSHSYQDLRRPWGLPGLVPGIRPYRLAVHTFPPGS
ncbi:MAG: hypothetical protein NVSMB32_16160 [Actinomycetota bacterium]